MGGELYNRPLFFARLEKRNGLPLPIEDPILLERFADDFGVNRYAPGLSLVVLARWRHGRGDEAVILSREWRTGATERGDDPPP